MLLLELNPFSSHWKKNLVLYLWSVSVETSLCIMSAIRAIGKRIMSMLKFMLRCASGKKTTFKKNICGERFG